MLKRILLFVGIAVLIVPATFAQISRLDSTVNYSYNSPIDSVRKSMVHYDKYNLILDPLHATKYYRQSADWIEYSEQVWAYQNGDLVRFEEFKIIPDRDGDFPPDYKYEDTFDGNGNLLERLIYSNKVDGLGLDPLWTKNYKTEYYYTNGALDSALIYSDLGGYWQGTKRVIYTLDGNNNITAEDVYNWYPEVQVKKYEGLYNENPSGSTIYAWNAYKIELGTTLTDLEAFVIDSRAELLNVYINDGTNDIRHNLHGVAGKTLRQVFEGDNDEQIVIDITQVRDNYHEWFKTIEEGSRTLINCNVKEGRGFENDEAVIVNDDLISKNASGTYYDNTAYEVKEFANMDHLDQFTLPTDIDWASIYVLNDPADPESGYNRIDVMDAGGKTLRQLLEGESIAISELSQKYAEWFENKTGNKRLIKLNIKATKIFETGYPVETYAKLFNSGETNDYFTTGYFITNSATMTDLYAITIPATADWLSVYVLDNGSEVRKDLHGVAGKTLGAVFEGDNTEGTLISLADLRYDYREWFQDGSNGRRVLINLNAKAVDDLGPTQRVKETTDLYTTGDSGDYYSVAYKVHNAATDADLKLYTLPADAYALDVYVKKLLFGYERYQLHGVAGKTLDAVLKGDNDEKLVLGDIANLYDNFYEWFLDANGNPVLINLNLKTLTFLNPQPVVMTDSLYSSSGAFIFNNVAYNVKEFAMESDLANYTTGPTIDYLNVYYTDAAGESVRASLHGVAGKTLQSILNGSNDENLIINIDNLRHDYVEWFIDADGRAKLIRMNIKSVEQKNTGLANMVRKTENTYDSGDNLLTSLVTEYDDNSQPFGDREQTKYYYNLDGTKDYKLILTSPDGTTWTDKEKYTYEYHATIGKLEKTTYYVYNTGTSTYDIKEAYFNYYATNPVSITLEVSPANAGTIDAPDYFFFGEEVSVTARAAAGYRFDNWTENGNEVSTDTTLTFVVNAPTTYVANFIKTFDVSVGKEPNMGGMVFGGGTFDSLASVTVRATPLPSYRFVNWSENGTEVATDSIYTFELTEDRNLMANFIRQYDVQALVRPDAAGSVTGTGKYDSLGTATLTATPVEGYEFTYWFDDYEIISTDPTVTISNIDSDKLLIAYFSVVTGIGDKFGEDYTLYPNPATNKFFVELPFDTQSNIDVMLINSAGQVFVPEYKVLSKRKLQVETLALPGGLYNLRVTSGDNVSNIKVIVEK